LKQKSDERDEEKDEMFSYYEAQAGSYDDFYQGKGTAVPALASEYPVDTNGVSALLSGFGQGDVVDLACGTAFWLAAYGPNCTSVTLVDQSTAALAQCRRRVRELGLRDVAQVVQGDVFNVSLPKPAYASALVGFLLSHLTEPHIDALFNRLQAILQPRSELAIVDSAWSEARRPYRERDGFERRVVPDGRAYMIRKRYFDRADLDSLLVRYGFQIRSAYVGKVFIATVAERTV
jgi:SAM-dependent methyltransferase